MVRLCEFFWPMGSLLAKKFRPKHSISAISLSSAITTLQCRTFFPLESAVFHYCGHRHGRPGRVGTGLMERVSSCHRSAADSAGATGPHSQSSIRPDCGRQRGQCLLNLLPEMSVHSKTWFISIGIPKNPSMDFLEIPYLILLH